MIKLANPPRHILLGDSLTYILKEEYGDGTSWRFNIYFPKPKPHPNLTPDETGQSPTANPPQRLVAPDGELIYITLN